ncbi:NAD-dependent epimerase/dehydratase family protein [Aliarcobacter skirrowii]|uniref:NAD-dependent epimerase/dehydratase family protein n=1 Tax=Aliarcobacter skirrowii TaxID=28200 RepID=UPI0029AF5FC4|nr:NAD-dependent epimerase/dehydratase family protein [Aliarcobacter skirrowii]MDX4068096.1 NAD-dependent epimerase/dehydratase family protein [Aliarcobacter skirrowii]
MLNVLVTGSNGFIGKNLLKKLNINNFNILEFNRNDTLDILEKQIIQSDFIVHLAGEVRPNSSSDDFKKSNSLLTQNIIDILKKQNKKTPILMASTIHAKLLKNEYGKTKREAEVLIEEYSKNENVNCFIYRLPHVFGESCKPNYNSVISTWIYNSIHDLEINCFDRSIEMHYVYVQDVVDEFVYIIKANLKKDLYMEPKKVYIITLGEVVDIIYEFKQNIQNDSYKIYNSEFKEKLFNTYLDYYRSSNV